MRIDKSLRAKGNTPTSCRGPIIRNYESAANPFSFEWREPPSVSPNDLKLGKSMKVLPKGTPFPANYLPPRVSVNACYAFDKVGLQHKRTKLLNEYHRSWITQDTLKAATLGYSKQNYVKAFDDEILQRAVNSVRDDFRDKLKNPLLPWSIDKVMRDGKMPKQTSPGLPYIQRGYKSKDDAYRDDHIHIKRMHQDVRKGKNVRFPDCAAFARNIVSKKDTNKVRLVWAYPLSQVLLEAKYAYPLIEAIIDQKVGTSLAYGAETQKGGMKWLDEQLAAIKSKYPDSKFCCIDYSSFDQTIPPWLIRIAFDIIEECFDFSAFQDIEGVRKTDVKSTDYEWRQIKNYFINTPLRMENGDRFMKTGGVPSGSCFTNLIDSIVNLIVMNYILEATTGNTPKYMIVLGDDSVSAVIGKVNFDNIALCAREKFGMIINEKKSFWTNKRENVQFLGYYNDFGFPIRDSDTLMATMLLPDSCVDESLSLTAARFLGVTQASCGSSIWFIILTEFLFKEIRLKGEDYVVDAKKLYHITKQFGWLPAAGEESKPLPKLHQIRNSVIPTEANLA